MTDKQIIIDGVDVSGCTHKNNDACMAITDFSGDFCYYCNEEIMKDCYYKQLKRKEQECEILKDEYKILEDNLDSRTRDFEELCDKQCEQLDQLKAENKTQKETIDGFLTILDKLGKSNIKLRETLTEIKEYCTDMKKDHYWGMRMMRFANEVLQKISEVEE